MSQRNPVLETARIHWQGNTPVNEQFGDGYYSKQDGIAESTHVFLAGNRLPERWNEFEASSQSRFSILETGFGSGLNFALTAKVWSDFQTNARPAHLSKLAYTSIEGFPLKRDDLAAIINSWSKQFAITGRLIESCPPPIEGIYSIDFGAIELRLVQMPLARALSEFEPKWTPAFDCLFLDGFAPAKNEAMWRESSLRQLCALCRDEATFSTFTAAGHIRRSLAHAGFTIKKIKGYGRKREMLTGIMNRNTLPQYRDKTPWFTFSGPVTHGNHPVVIIGGGVAGCASARALADQGIKCTLIDAGEAPGGTLTKFKASIYAPLLSADFNLASQFYWSGFTRLQQYLNDQPQVEHNACGIFHIASTIARRKMLEAVYQKCRKAGLNVRWLDAGQTQESTGLPLEHPGLLIAHGGWINAGSYCRQLLDHPLIETRFSTRVEHLELRSSRWSVQFDGKTMETHSVVLCGGQDTRLLNGFWQGKLNAIKGQSSTLSDSQLCNKLKCVLNNGHYLLPCGHPDSLIAGSSYELEYECVDQPQAGIDIANLAALQGINQDLDNILDAHSNRLKHHPQSSSPTGIRLASPDHLPLIGAAPDLAFYQTHYPESIISGRLKHCPDAKHWPGLFINTAHGSRAMTSSLIGAELIAAMITSQPYPLPTRLYQAVHPARFFVREQLASCSTAIQEKLNNPT